MNRKNTIIAAVFINAALLAILFVAAATVQEETFEQTILAKEEPLVLPELGDLPLFQGAPPLPIQESVPQEPVVHRLPPLVEESVSIAQAPPALPPRPEAPTFTPAERLLKEVVVKKGDSLEKLAKVYQTSVDEIIRLNHLPSSFLKIGQILKMPEAKKNLAQVEKKALEVNPEYYTIKVGENPWAIAMKHHMKLDELLRLNGLNEEKARKLKPGDRLRIR